ARAPLHLVRSRGRNFLGANLGGSRPHIPQDFGGIRRPVFRHDHTLKGQMDFGTGHPLYPVPTEKTRGSAVVEDVIRNDILVVAPVASLARRRVLFGLLVALSIGGLVALLTRALSAGGFGALDFILVVLFAVTLPWSVIGFLNGVIG